MQRSKFDHISGFQSLIQQRINEILLVASLYDAFILAQDGQLQELITSEFANLNLYHAPRITRVSKASKALELMEERRPYDMILMTMNVGDMHVMDFARRLREQGVKTPIILLTYDNRTLDEMLAQDERLPFDRVFIWQGDFRILLAIVKLVEDQLNVEHDTKVMGVQTIILVEDNIRFYSSYLPSIYTEIVKQAHRLIDEGLNLAHKMIRMRARPKIILCNTFEEAWAAFEKYGNHLLGIITDLEFPREGRDDPLAGALLARKLRDCCPELPVMIQSNQEHVQQIAGELRVSAAYKNSPTLLHELRSFMRDNFGFGDFVFRLQDGTAIARVRDLHGLEKQLADVPDESLQYHAERGHFSKWLKARTEFGLARSLQVRKVSDYPDLAAVRAYLVQSLSDYRQDRTRGLVAEFNPETFDAGNSVAQIGSGSMGGKARGLTFVRHLINLAELRDRYPDVRIAIPPAVVLCTEVFDQFMEYNELQTFAIGCDEDELIRGRFLDARFPPLFQIDLQHLVQLMDYPLAVRSSSLLEDSQYQPFAGIYSTIMLPNNQADASERLHELLQAIKQVYASTYFQAAKGYIRSTPYRIEEEKMAVVIQKLQGSRHGDLFYPDISGVARSYNFYPSEPARPEDGVAGVALGLGHLVAQGSEVVRFCPRYPKRSSTFKRPEDALKFSQKQFYALRLQDHPAAEEVAGDAGELVLCGLDRAEVDGTLQSVASVYSPENDAIYDGLSRPGARFVSFAPVLKYDVFPLADIVSRLLKIGERGMSRPVELELAASLHSPAGEPKEFAVLQMRPLVLSRELDELDLTGVEPGETLCRSEKVLGAGLVDHIHDLVMVDIERFDRSHSRQVAQEVGRFNRRLSAEGRPFLLVGVGRWGSSDPWLGIPVSWDQISGVGAIVESGFRDIVVTPSQGSHFFQNLCALGIGYFTVNPEQADGELDWDWLREQVESERMDYVRHLRFRRPIVIMMDGRRRMGVILKPEA